MGYKLVTSKHSMDSDIIWVTESHRNELFRQTNTL